ncbi:MAG: hypothetical protein R2715_19580 [Ilumatobacteraceae bacterium]
MAVQIPKVITQPLLLPLIELTIIPAIPATKTRPEPRRTNFQGHHAILAGEGRTSHFGTSTVSLLFVANARGEYPGRQGGPWRDNRIR